MTFKISIKEVREAVVCVEANSYTQALKKAENKYLEHLNDYLLQMEETKRFLIQIEGHHV
jgi:hypothetical protein